jgi:hypothetical protein
MQPKEGSARQIYPLLRSIRPSAASIASLGTAAGGFACVQIDHAECFFRFIADVRHGAAV